MAKEQLFLPGQLSSPNLQSLRLEVYPAGEAEDATVTDGEVLGATHAAESCSEVAPLVCASADIGVRVDAPRACECGRGCVWGCIYSFSTYKDAGECSWCTCVGVHVCAPGECV